MRAPRREFVLADIAVELALAGTLRRFKSLVDKQRADSADSLIQGALRNGQISAGLAAANNQIGSDLHKSLHNEFRHILAYTIHVRRVSFEFRFTPQILQRDPSVLPEQYGTANFNKMLQYAGYTGSK
jgi:hypothetical protein